LTLLQYRNVTETLASYAYTYDNVGNRTHAVETLATPVPSDAFEESDGLVVFDAEHFAANIARDGQAWITSTALSGYTGTAYLQATPDRGALYEVGEVGDSPELQYYISFVTTGTYRLWLYGAATDAAGDSVHVGLGEQIVSVSGFAPGQWTWANEQIGTLSSGGSVTLTVGVPGVYVEKARKPHCLRWG
jgi:hypothetical protein